VAMCTRKAARSTRLTWVLRAGTSTCSDGADAIADLALMERIIAAGDVARSREGSRPQTLDYETNPVERIVEGHQIERMSITSLTT